MVQQTISLFLTIFAITYSSCGDVIVLSTGERLELQILNQKDATVRVHHAILGEFTIDSSDITSIEIKEQSTTPNKTKPTSAASETPAASSNWDQSISVGLNVQNGQKDTKSLHSQLESGVVLEKSSTLSMKILFLKGCLARQFRGIFLICKHSLLIQHGTPTTTTLKITGSSQTQLGICN